MPKRLSEPFQIISRLDTVIPYIDDATLKKYFTTLNIDELGDLTLLPEVPVVFTVRPLESKYARIDCGDDNTFDNHWRIFSLHVDAADNIDFQLSFDTSHGTKALHEDMKDLFPVSWIKDISEIIIAKASADGCVIPFLVPASLPGQIHRHRLLLAPPKVSPASGEDAKTSE
jgi:hypothetical protein